MKLTRVLLAVLLSAGLSSHPARADAFMALGRHAATARTVIVSPGATETEGGANLQNALESVSGTAARPVRLKEEKG